MSVCSMRYFEHAYTKVLFVVYLKVNFSGAAVVIKLLVTILASHLGTSSCPAPC